MPKRSFAAMVVLFLAASSAPAADKFDPAGIAFFEKKIRPLLVQHCLKCHSKDEKVKAGLHLDSRAGMLAGGESGAAVVPGKPDDSLLMEALRHESFEMPPGKKLPESTIADFAKWIKLGAPDPRVAKTAAYEKKEIDIEQGRKFWSFQPPRKTSPPTVSDPNWPRSIIDFYVLAKLDEQRLRPVADAPRPALVRRLYFDLIGLPPTREQVEEFLSDDSPQATEKLVDRLLDSPHFGERWGRHWLDIARYGESNGNVDNLIFPHAWRYRDYVIRSFNEDKPYDRFITEQVAGDLLPYESPRERNEHLVATGFLALTSKPRPQNNPNFEMDLVADQIEVTTTATMALTVACARCHDHKFDPIPTSEYYALAGIFDSSKMLYGRAGRKNRRQSGLHQLMSVGKGDEESEQATSSNDRQVAKLKAELASAQAELRKIAGGKKGKKNQRKGGKAVNKTRQRDLRRDIKRLTKKLRDLADGPRGKASGPAAMGVAEGTPGDCRICLRGESEDRGEEVPRGFISVATIGRSPHIPQDQSGRLQLARWITSPQNPLTARVAVNRIWQHLMGRGIVATVDNFGRLGEKPSHPQLLDALAIAFVKEDGWSVKRMIRRIVLSRTYQLSGSHDEASYTADPQNVFLWRHSPRRLEAEVIRDSILAVSGTLDRTPPRGSAVTRYAGATVQNGKVTPDIFQRFDHEHRSVYLPVVRNATPEALELFNFPDASLVVGRREVTTVPAQALYLLNSPFVIEKSRKMADRLLAAKVDDRERINLAYQIALSRAASRNEGLRAHQHLKTAEKSFAGGGNDARRLAWASFCQAIFASAEFRYVP